MMQYQDAKRPAPLVELEAGDIYISMLMEAGPVKSAPMGGYAALDWVDIAAYVELTMVEVEAWEAVLLRRMSEVYAKGLDEGRNPLSIPPMERA